jgi:hypothetical protein
MGLEIFYGNFTVHFEAKQSGENSSKQEEKSKYLH